MASSTTTSSSLNDLNLPDVDPMADLTDSSTPIVSTFYGCLENEREGLFSFPISKPLPDVHSAAIASKTFPMRRGSTDSESTHIVRHIDSGDVSGDEHMREISIDRLHHLSCLNTATIAALLVHVMVFAMSF